MHSGKTPSSLRIVPLCVDRSRRRWRRRQETSRNTRKLMVILRNEPRYAARIVDLFVRERVPIAVIAASLALAPDAVRRNLSRIIELFEANGA